MPEPAIDSRFQKAASADYDARIPKLVPGYELLHLLTTAQATARLPVQAHVLVVGAGTGQEVLQLAREKPQWRFTATDLSPDMLAIAAQRFAAEGIAARVQTHAGPLDSLPETPQHDAALLILVTHFVPDDGRRQNLFDGIAKHLKPGALLLLADLMLPGDEVERQVQKQAAMLLGLSQAAAGTMLERLQQDFHPVSPTRLRQLLAKSGFTPPVPYFRSLGFQAFTSIYSPLNHPDIA